MQQIYEIAPPFISLTHTSRRCFQNTINSAKGSEITTQKQQTEDRIVTRIQKKKDRLCIVIALTTSRVNSLTQCLHKSKWMMAIALNNLAKVSEITTQKQRSKVCIVTRMQKEGNTYSTHIKIIMSGTRGKKHRLCIAITVTNFQK